MSEVALFGFFAFCLTILLLFGAGFVIFLKKKSVFPIEHMQCYAPMPDVALSSSPTESNEYYHIRLVKNDGSLIEEFTCGLENKTFGDLKDMFKNVLSIECNGKEYNSEVLDKEYIQDILINKKNKIVITQNQYFVQLQKPQEAPQQQAAQN